MKMPDLSDNGVRLTQVAAIVVAAVALFWRLGEFKAVVERQIESVQTDLRDTVRKIDDLKTNAFTQAQAAETALRFAILNPSVGVPDPRNPGQVIEVRLPK